MRVSNPKHADILRAIGLSSFDYYDKSQFQVYVDSTYPNSRQEEEDEVYRMHEYIMFHNASGLIVTYFTIESYDGNQVEYLVGTPFVITNQEQRIAVITIKS